MRECVCVSCVRVRACLSLPLLPPPPSLSSLFFFFFFFFFFVIFIFYFSVLFFFFVSLLLSLPSLFFLSFFFSLFFLRGKTRLDVSIFLFKYSRNLSVSPTDTPLRQRDRNPHISGEREEREK